MILSRDKKNQKIRWQILNIEEENKFPNERYLLEVWNKHIYR